MKKIYSKPNAEIVEIATEYHLLDGSTFSVKGRGNIPTDGTFEQYSKENDFDLFEDEEE